MSSHSCLPGLTLSAPVYLHNSPQQQSSAATAIATLTVAGVVQQDWRALVRRSLAVRDLRLGKWEKIQPAGSKVCGNTLAQVCCYASLHGTKAGIVTWHAGMAQHGVYHMDPQLGGAHIRT